MPPNHEPATTLRALSGTTAHVLLAFLAYPDRSLGTNDLVDLTNRSQKTITKALRALHTMSLVQRHGRYNAWQLTARIHQLVFRNLQLSDSADTTQPGPEREPENLRLPPGSCSSSPKKMNSLLLTKPTTTTEREPENLRLPDEWQTLADLLVHKCGAPRALATSAIAAAHDRGDFPGYVEYHILRWLSYCTSDDGRGINSPAIFIPSRIRDDVPCPDWHRAEAWSPLAREIRRAKARWDAESDTYQGEQDEEPP